VTTALVFKELVDVCNVRIISIDEGVDPERND
jgi:hypothetical protein